ncbi:MAG: glycosyltransferase, partial [Rhodopirellula sp.]|nr:glycosyltransferase [Rhodopirellula sp.]
VDVERFSTAQPADLSQFEIPQGSSTILSVGRLDEQKNPLGLLRSFAAIAELHRETHLLFVGRGPLETTLRAAATKSGLEARVHIAGWQADVPGIMRASDVFVLASNWEGMPNVLLEAGAAGIPVVSTRVEGAEEIVTSSESGVLVGICREDQLASAIADCLSDPQSAKNRAVRLQRLIAEEFTWSSVVDSYSQLYESLLG